jgi:hypothetical protein
MARDQELVKCAPGAWTELTNGDVTEITFQVQSGSVKIRCTTGAAPSNLTDPGYIYHARPSAEQGEQGETRIAIADLAAGAGVDRVWAMPINGRTADVLVDHA